VNNHCSGGIKRHRKEKRRGRPETELRLSIARFQRKRSSKHCIAASGCGHWNWGGTDVESSTGLVDARAESQKIIRDCRCTTLLRRSENRHTIHLSAIPSSGRQPGQRGHGRAISVPWTTSYATLVANLASKNIFVTTEYDLTRSLANCSSRDEVLSPMRRQCTISVLQANPYANLAPDLALRTVVGISENGRLVSPS